MNDIFWDIEASLQLTTNYFILLLVLYLEENMQMNMAYANISYSSER